MKKVLILGVLLAFFAPVLAADEAADRAPKHKNGPRHEMIKKDPAFKAKMEAAKAERKAKKAQFKATEEKLEKLVKKYKAAKAGSKKQAELREEIAQVLAGVRDEQVAIRTKQIEGFEKRLTHMKERLAKEQEPSAKTAWVERMTDKVIAEDGDLEDALEREGRMHKPPFKTDGPIGPRGEFGKKLPPPPPHMD